MCGLDNWARNRAVLASFLALDFSSRRRSNALVLVSLGIDEGGKMNRPRIAFLVAAVSATACCPGTLGTATRSWATKNLPHYKSLVDERYPADSQKDTRLKSYQSMASLVCTADTADDKKESAACKCQKPFRPEDADSACTDFFKSLQ